MIKRTHSFDGAHHYSEGGKEWPVSPEEEYESKRRTNKSKFFLFLVWMTVTAGMLYFVGMIAKELGFNSNYLFPILSGIWILALIVLGSIIYSRKISNILSGKIIEMHQEKKE